MTTDTTFRGAPDSSSLARAGRGSGRAAFTLLLLVTVAGCGPRSTDQAETDAEHAAEEAASGPPMVLLDSMGLATSGIRLGEAREVSRGGLIVTGDITYDQNRVSHIGPKTQGRVVELMVEVGAPTVGGQVLAHLESPDVGATRAELGESEALMEIARENFDRERRLAEQGISSRREVLDAEAELRRTEARAGSARERLRVLGASLHGEGGHFDVTAPYDGTVVERHAARGEVVGPADQLFTVADLSRLWIELDVYERDLSRVAQGDPVEVSTPAWPDRTFQGRVVYVGDIVAPERRTVRARVELPNEDRALKPGMFATARIGGAGGPMVVAVPRDAVQTVEGVTSVWVLGDEPGEFVVQPVEIGESLPGGLVAVSIGLSPGDSLVVEGAFTLKSELAKGEFGGHGH